MLPRLLLDTHVIVRWLSNPKKLSKIQRRTLEIEEAQDIPIAISAMTLLEIGVLVQERDVHMRSTPEELLAEIDSIPELVVLPITVQIAIEVAALGPSLRDPADRAIVATARVHRLKLVTSDQRIVSSHLVATVE